MDIEKIVERLVQECRENGKNKALVESLTNTMESVGDDRQRLVEEIEKLRVAVSLSGEAYRDIISCFVTVIDRCKKDAEGLARGGEVIAADAVNRIANDAKAFLDKTIVPGAPT